MPQDFRRLAGQIGTSIYQSEQHPVHLQGRVNPLFYPCDVFDKLGHALGGQVVGLHRDNHAVRRSQGVDRNHTQGRHTVDEHYVVIFLCFVDIGA